jgi:small subunit ribosomal protein S24e
LNIEIETKKDNPLMDRVEVRFDVIHTGEATPTRAALRAELANILGVNKDRIIIDNVLSNYGITKSSGYAKVYGSVESAKKYESDYLLDRYGLGKEE